MLTEQGTSDDECIHLIARCERLGERSQEDVLSLPGRQASNHADRGGLAHVYPRHPFSGEHRVGY